MLEVRLRRLLDAVGAVPEVDRVQVRRQDPLLRPAARVALQLPGERGLAHLARDRALVAVERVLDELLRDRRAALDDLLVPDVGDERAADAAHVDAVVLPEAAVLDGDDRVAHRVGDVLVLDERPRLGAPQDGEHAVPVGGVDVAVHLLVELALRIELRRDLARDRPDQAEGERHGAQDPEDGDEPEEAELANAAALRTAGFFVNGRKGRKSKSGGSPDHGEDVVRVALELGRPEALHRGEIGRRARLRGGELAQGRVVEDDVRGNLVGARPLAAPGAQPLEEGVVGRRRRRSRRSRQLRARNRAQQPEAVVALELLERAGQLEQLDPALHVGLARRREAAEGGRALRRPGRARRAAQHRREPGASERPAQAEDGAGESCPRRRPGAARSGRHAAGGRERRADVAHAAVLLERLAEVLGDLPVAAAARLGEAGRAGRRA